MRGSPLSRGGRTEGIEEHARRLSVAEGRPDDGPAMPLRRVVDVREPVRVDQAEDPPAPLGLVEQESPRGVDLSSPGSATTPRRRPGMTGRRSYPVVSGPTGRSSSRISSTCPPFFVPKSIRVF